MENTNEIEPFGKRDNLPNSSVGHSESEEVDSAMEMKTVPHNDAAKILLSAAHQSSDAGDLEDDEHNKNADGLKNKFSKWKTKATSLYEDNNSIAKIKKMGNALEVKSGFKMGIKMSSNALGSVVHAVLPKPSSEEGKVTAKDKKSVSILVDASSHHSASFPTHSETTSASSSLHAPMSSALNSGLMVNTVTSNSNSYSSSDDDGGNHDDEDDSESEESEYLQEDGTISHHDAQSDREHSNQPTPLKHMAAARSESDLQSLSTPPPSSPNLIRGRYAPASSSSKPPQKKRSSLDQIQSGITSVANITTGIATMSAFTVGQTGPSISSNTPSLAHSSSQLSESSLNIASFYNLPPGQYGVTIGPGMLGVHLKQSYWPTKGGVYIDSIVPGGHAEKSKVMMVGDTIVKVGDQDVSKGTVSDVPKIIGRARRPVLLVCTGEFPVDKDKMDPLTAAFGIITKIREQAQKNMSSLPILSSSGLTNDVVSSTTAITMSEKRATSFDSGLNMDPQTSMIPLQDIVSMPLKERIQSVPNFLLEGSGLDHNLASLASKRTNQAISLTTLSKAVQNDPEFIGILREAFVTCCLDSRRLPFYAQYLTNEDSLGLDVVSANVRLMAYTELLTFKDLYPVSPNSKKIEYAKRIAYKFFLRNPNFASLPKDPNESFDESAPMFDLRPIFDTNTLVTLESVINASNKKSVPKNLFEIFELQLESSLTGSKFASFLISDECARMRAYLRGTNPYVNAPLEVVYRNLLSGSTSDKICAQNHLIFMILYLICQSENEPDMKMDNSSGFDNKVPLSSLGRLFAPIFIHRSLIPAIDHFNKIYEGQCSDPNNITVTSLRQLFELLDQFWQTFIAEDSGMVEGSIESKEAQAALLDTRKHILSLVDASNKELAEDVIDPHLRLARLQIVKLRKSLNILSDELLYEHAITFNRKYKEHLIHEWMCGEAKKVSISSGGLHPIDSSNVIKNEATFLPPLAPGCVTRLMRRVELPKGVSRHRPLRADKGIAFDSSSSTMNAECAIIFGSSNTGTQLNSATVSDDSKITRFATVTLTTDDNSSSGHLTEDTLPPTLESYAITPSLKARSFSRLLDHGRVCADGWEVSLVSFVVPKSNKSDALDDNIYGASLVLRRSLIYPSSINATLVQLKIDIAQLVGDLDQLNQVNWADTMKDSDDAVIGIMLLSRKNVLLSMRKTLSDFYDSITSGTTMTGSPELHVCTPLVNLLGVFERKADPEVLRSILGKYLEPACAQWIGKERNAQGIAFDNAAADLLISSLPPIPLALLFISALLEQKIVFSSCRRSVLVSVTIALKNLLSPLNWTHLFVPVVPPALANDLVQYPAPFILGIPVEDKGSLQLLNALPADVTLVDLDVGRVILAKNIAYDSELIKSGRDSNAILSALRTQILYLAEAIGSVFASCLYSDAWLCDGPSPKDSNPLLLTEVTSTGVDSSSSKVSHVCHAFIEELLEGSNTCCFWIREAMDEGARKLEQETSILFDEHRFFYIKNLRAGNKMSYLFPDEKIRSRIFGTEERKKSISSSLALSMESYDLVLETFVRGQGMSSYLSSSSSTDSAFW